MTRSIGIFNNSNWKHEDYIIDVGEEAFNIKPGEILWLKATEHSKLEVSPVQGTAIKPFSDEKGRQVTPYFRIEWTGEGKVPVNYEGGRPTYKVVGMPKSVNE